MKRKPNFPLFLGATLFSILLATSCQTTRKIATSEVKPMTVSKILKRVEKEAPIYKSVESKKVAIDFESNNLKTNISAQLSIQKNKIIFVSAKKISLPIAKILITPDSLKMINYLQKNYLSDDIASLQRLIGADVDFDLIQAILTADISKFLEDKQFDKELKVSIDSQMYKLDGEQKNSISGKNSDLGKKTNKEFNNYSVWIDPQLFVVRKVLLSNKNNETISIDYDQFVLAGRNMFPQQILLEHNSPTKNLKLNLKLTKPTINKVKDFNFVVPDKFEKYKLSRN